MDLKTRRKRVERKNEDGENHFFEQILREIHIEITDETGDRTGFQHADGKGLSKGDVIVRTGVRV